MGRLDGKVAVVTGGASGIGAASVRRFLEEGAKVVIADVQEDLGRQLQEDLGPNSLFVRTDVAQAESVSSAVRWTVQQFGRLDVLFNNAAILVDGMSIVDFPDDVFDKTVSVNLKGVFYGMKYAIPEMLKLGGGSIINTGSTAGLVGYWGQSAYGATKGAVVQLTRHAATEWADQNIRVNCICPGGILTPLVFSRRPGVPEEDVIARFAGTNPMGRAGQPNDIASAALWLASDESAFVTGQVIAVDGGRTASVYRGKVPKKN